MILLFNTSPGRFASSGTDTKVMAFFKAAFQRRVRILPRVPSSSHHQILTLLLTLYSYYNRLEFSYQILPGFDRYKTQPTLTYHHPHAPLLFYESRQSDPKPHIFSTHVRHYESRWKCSKDGERVNVSCKWVQTSFISWTGQRLATYLRKQTGGFKKRSGPAREWLHQCNDLGNEEGRACQRCQKCQ